MSKTAGRRTFWILELVLGKSNHMHNADSLVQQSSFLQQQRKRWKASAGSGLRKSMFQGCLQTIHLQSFVCSLPMAVTCRFQIYMSTRVAVQMASICRWWPASRPRWISSRYLVRKPGHWLPSSQQKASTVAPSLQPCKTAKEMHQIHHQLLQQLLAVTLIRLAFN